MGTTEDKRKRFELLIKQGEVPAIWWNPIFGWCDRAGRDKQGQQGLENNRPEGDLGPS